MLFNASSYAEVFASLHYAVTAGLLGWPKSFEPAFKNKKYFSFPIVEVLQWLLGFRNSHRRCLKNFAKFTAKHLRQKLLSRPQACNFIKKETVAQAFSCEFSKIFKNTFFKEYLRVTASVRSHFIFPSSDS